MRLLSLILILSSCTPSLYYVTTDSTFEQVNGLNYKRKLIYLDEGIGDLGKLDSIANLINKRKWKKLDILRQTLADRDQKFIGSAKSIIIGDFLLAYEQLKFLPENDYNCQVKILKTDCLYEIGIDSVDFKSNYQEAMNCAQTEIIKSIINTRYRFLRYEQ